MQQISPEQLQRWLADVSRDPPLLLDVREPWEYQICHMANSLLVPIRTLPARQDELDPEAATVIICHHGMRSFQVALYLERAGFRQIHNLTGGIDAWARSGIEPRAAIY